MVRRHVMVLFLIYPFFSIKTLDENLLRRVKINNPLSTEIQILNTSTSKLEIVNAIKNLLSIALDTEDENIREKTIILATDAIIKLLELEQNGNGQQLDRLEQDKIEYFTDQIASIFALTRRVSDIKEGSGKKLIVSFFYKFLYIILKEKADKLQLNPNFLPHVAQQLNVCLEEILIRGLKDSEVVEFIDSIQEFHKTRPYDKELLAEIIRIIEQRHFFSKSLRIKLDELRNKI